ncbi:TonB-dependent receptor domain-containing protein [Marinimicrobium alkaliphilum]|uniref:TonB-dependent receptor domain-containing protein n=1 Tax=Marinimicrobium alkaliphilum TaxID=2202654 RepID=UPI000DB98761|nr:TonB-dependent receptor [Marinimicrobium alkaliphilum]
MRKKHSLGLIAAVVTSLGAGASAETIDLGRTVISAAGFEQKIADAPASVSVVSREELQSKPYTSLADALRDVEGIDVGSSLDKNGNMSITLRGLPADYTLVLINGRRQNDVGNIGPNNFGNSQFMYMPPLSAIERIEVVRGPMSTLYGSDAIGGVINIITRTVSESWAGSITTSLNLQEDSQFGDDRKTEFYASGPLIDGHLGLTVRGSLYNREESDPGYSDRLPLPETDVDGNPNPPFWEDTGSFGDRKIVEAQTWNLGTTLAWVVSEGQELLLDYDVAKQRYDNTQGQTGTLDGVESLWRVSNAGIVQPRVGYTEYQRFEREQWALTHRGRWDFGRTEASVSRLTSSNLGRSLPLTIAERQALQQIWNDSCPALDDCRVSNSQFIMPEGVANTLAEVFLPRPLRTLESSNTTVDTRLDTQLGAHTLAFGAQYIDAEMKDGTFGMDGAGFQEGVVQPHRQWALFAEDHWGLRHDLTLTLGARYDDHNMFGGNVSPRGYINWQASSDWSLKGGVSTGYIAPRPDQLYPGITGFGGQGVSPFVGSPDLQPETSLNYEVAAYFDNQRGLSANVTVFHTEFEDKIARADAVPNCFDASGNRVNDAGCVDIGPGWAELGFTSFGQSTNIDRAVSTGVEVGTRIAFTPSVMLRANYTWTDSEQKSGNNAGRPIMNTPEHMANATLSWQALEPLTLSLVSEVRSKRFRTVTSTGQEMEQWHYYKAYELFHLSARYQASDSLAINARINNVLNDDLSGRSCNLNDTQSGYNCIPDYNTTEKARSLWLSADMSF